MNCSDFTYEPLTHPFGMLQGYSHASEKESILMLLLKHCLAIGDLTASRKFIHDHPTMVEDELLEETGEQEYKLTNKSLGLLYSVYGV